MTPDKGQFPSSRDPSGDDWAEDPIDKISISNWKLLARGALTGVFDAELQSGLILLECSLFHKDGKHWVTMLQKQYQVGGVTKYRAAIGFANRTTAVELQDAVMQALRESFPEVLS